MLTLSSQHSQRWFALAVFLNHMIGCVSKSRSLDRHINVINNSGRAVQLYWVHPDSDERVLMSDPYIIAGAEYPVNSWVGHIFEVREVPNKATGECKSSNGSHAGVCHSTIFEVNENDNQVVNVEETFEISFMDNKIKAHNDAAEIVKSCKARASIRIQAAGSNAVEAQKGLDELLQCVQAGVATELEKVHEEIAFQADIRQKISAALENYTCIDDSLDSTEDIAEDTWVDPKGDASYEYKVHIKLDRKASKIHVIDNFIRPDECAMTEELAQADLHRAAVADGKGGAQISVNRKAMQAGIKVPWEDESNGNPVARVSRRVYDYTNHVLDLDIDEYGQEDLMSIQYFGRGQNDTEPDRYTPHCDGDCSGLPHVFGQRMATMVMYCDVANAGGHTNFGNAGVHVKPEKYSAVFFSYIDPIERIMDDGFTQHSGCPVFDGEKKIVTQWIRLGVDQDNPWDSFNTLGIKLSELEEEEGDLEGYEDGDILEAGDD